ncbi:MAG: tRNA (guanosine(46)-N7)-methyltransferase TrmB [Ignavibacteriales bacterium]|nr:tRNA (guanosine(46)-N7)-methyltransferase TrmB [Ignavibacteriales bacterium]
MPRKKQKKINEAFTFENVFYEKQENVFKLLCDFLGSDKPVTLELGCGQADYTVNMARLFPEKNFIGIDRKPNRIWNASKNGTESKLKNAVFLIAYIERLAEVFPPQSVEEIWITFPDPYQRRSNMKKRLTHPRFLNTYKKFLIDGGKVNLKTDDETLYNYTLEVVEKNGLKLLKSTDDLYASQKLTEVEEIKTKYEKMHLAEGKKITLVSFCI